MEFFRCDVPGVRGMYNYEARSKISHTFGAIERASIDML